MEVILGAHALCELKQTTAGSHHLVCHSSMKGATWVCTAIPTKTVGLMNGMTGDIVLGPATVSKSEYEQSCSMVVAMETSAKGHFGRLVHVQRTPDVLMRELTI